MTDNFPAKLLAASREQLIDEVLRLRGELVCAAALHSEQPSPANEKTMITPIDNLKKKYGSAPEHLRAIEDALAEQFNITDREQLRKALWAAFHVGHSTTTSNDWCDTW